MNESPVSTAPTSAIATKPRQTLFTIHADILTLDQLLDEANGDISDPAVEAATVALFAELAQDEAKKLDGWCAWLKQLDMEAAAASAEAKEWQAKATRRVNLIAWAKERLKQHLTTTGRAKVQTASGLTISVVANGGAAMLEVDDGVNVERLDEKWVVVRKELNRKAVMEALAAGEVVEWARFKVKGTHVRVK